MDKKKLIRLPVLFDSGGDLSKNWYIEFYVRNPRTNKLERQRIKQGINSIHTLKGRHALGENLIKEWGEKLRNGWTP
ncbi:MAG TPA: hypothetical protein VLQ91_15800 [Draconibacterium sp.]|nr:hypothetical protein [Draconibacterium sp.]